MDSHYDYLIFRIRDNQTTCDDQETAKPASEEPVVKDDHLNQNQPEPDQAQQPTVHFQTPELNVNHFECVYYSFFNT